MKNIKERKDSDIVESASVTSLMRYLLSEKQGLERNPDFLGKHFINGKWRKYLDNPAKSIKELQKKLPGCIYYHLIRTKFFDQSLDQWLSKEKHSQILILGSGFDTRAIRFSEKLKMHNTKVYEVDLDAMINYKKKIIEREFPDQKSNIVWVPCNFQKDDLIVELKNKNFDFSCPTLVLWEGVTYFLTEKIVNDYIKNLKEHIKNKLQITFDYAFKKYIDGNLEYYGAKELFYILIELGEPHYFGVNYENIEEYFEKNGFKVKSNLSSQMLEALFLRNEMGESVGKPHTFHGMAEILTNT